MIKHYWKVYDRCPEPFRVLWMLVMTSPLWLTANQWKEHPNRLVLSVVWIMILIFSRK